MATYFLVCQPKPQLEPVQFGLGGETAPNFLKRMERDVFPYEPTVATLFYGMNDGGYVPPDRRKLELFRDSMVGIVRAFKSFGTRFVVLGGPGVVDSHWFRRIDPKVYNETLAALSGAAKEVAEEEGVVFVDVHGIMMEAMQKAKAVRGQEFPVAGTDGVHPDANGHLAIAYAFLKALGCSGEIGTIDWNWKTQEVTASDGHQVLGVSDGTVKLRSTRYPFCFFGDPKSPAGTAGMVEFLPFNEDLNRFIFRVRNLGTGKVKVCWGKAAKEFDRNDLERGVNLAAEFMDNPFAVPFSAVQKRIEEQQAFETASMKQIMHSVPVWKEWFPEEETMVETFPGKILSRWGQLAAKSAQAVVPVEHVIAVQLLGEAEP